MMDTIMACDSSAHTTMGHTQSQELSNELFGETPISSVTAVAAAGDSNDDDTSAMAVIRAEPPSAAIATTLPLSHTMSTKHSKRRSSSNMMPSLSPLLLLLAQLLIALPASLAQTSTKCSCSPRKYVFKLNLAAICPPLPPPFPPNEVFGAGVKDYTCTIGPEPLPSAPQQLTSADTAPDLVTNEVVEDEELEEEEEKGDMDSK